MYRQQASCRIVISFILLPVKDMLHILLLRISIIAVRNHKSICKMEFKLKKKTHRKTHSNIRKVFWFNLYVKNEFFFIRLCVDHMIIVQFHGSYPWKANASMFLHGPFSANQCNVAKKRKCQLPLTAFECHGVGAERLYLCGQIIAGK